MNIVDNSGYYAESWAPSQYKTAFSRYGDSHVKDKTVARPSDLKHGDPILVRRHLYIETAPWSRYNRTALYLVNLQVIVTKNFQAHTDAPGVNLEVSDQLVDKVLHRLKLLLAYASRRVQYEDDVGRHSASWNDNVNISTLRPTQNGRHFPDDNFKCIFLNENIWMSIKMSLNFVPKGPINNIPALVQIMAWRLVGAKPLCETMMVMSNMMSAWI